MTGCDGYAASSPPGRPCPRQAKWLVEFGRTIASRFCNYHKGVAVEFNTIGADLKVTPLDLPVSAIPPTKE